VKFLHCMHENGSAEVEIISVCKLRLLRGKLEFLLMLDLLYGLADVLLLC